MSAQTMTAPAAPAVAPPRLLDQLRTAALSRFGRAEPGERFADWVRRYICSAWLCAAEPLFKRRSRTRQTAPPAP